MDRLIQAILVAMVVLAPLPLGSVAPWARSVLFVLACLLLSLWVFKSSLLGKIDITRTSLWFFLLAYLLVLLFQLLPLPAGLLALLSPKTAELYARLIPGYPGETGSLPLSLNAHATLQEIYRVSTFVIVLFVFVNQVRHRWQISVLLWAFVALGAFESLYGLAERFSGNPHVFWVQAYDRISVRGTYYNKNHFAGLMEMITPLVLGFMLTRMSRREKPFRSSTLPFFRQLLQNLAKSKGYIFLLLGLITGTMAVSGIFSLSRAGTAGLLLGFFLLLVLSGSGKGRKQKFGLVVASVLLLAVGLVFYRGMGKVIDRFEQLTDENSGWEARVELRRAGLRLFEDFPLLGSGGGTFADVFIPYHPPRFGDRVAHYLHCDWLQVPCETGVIGALLLYAGGGVFLLGLIKGIRRRSEPFPRLIAAGSFAGLAAMLLHSYFDFNLYMVTANGLVFAVLLGICHAAVHMKGKARGSRASFSTWTFPVREGPYRLLLPAAVLVLCVLASVKPVKLGLADLSFSPYLTWAEGKPDNYFFWKTPSLRTEEARQKLERAARLDRRSPNIQFHLGLFQVKVQEERLRSLARDLAYRVYDPGFALGGFDDMEESVKALAKDMTRRMTTEFPAPDENSEEFQSLVSAFEVPARQRLMEESAGVLRQAEPFFREAVRLCPTVPWFHLDQAVSAETLLPPGSVPEEERPKLARLVETAVSLAPSRPSTLYLAGWYQLKQALFGKAAGGEIPPEVLHQVLEGFRTALQWEPRAYAFRIYPLLLDQVQVDPQVLFRVTPDTFNAWRMLTRFFLDRGMWSHALQSVDTLLSFFPEGVATRISEALPPGIDPFEQVLQLSTQRMRILRRLGDAEGWNREARKIASLFESRCQVLQDQASWFTGLGRFLEAIKSSEDCLRVDPWNKAARLSLLRTAVRPDRFVKTDVPAEALSELFRFFRLIQGLTPEDCEQVTEILSHITPNTPTEHVYVQIAAALKAIRCGRPEEASQLLRALLVVKEHLFHYWNQRHLLNYYLGEALEAAGEREAAVAQYRAALALAPAHLPSLTRLAALGESDSVLPLPVSEPGSAGSGSPGDLLASLQAKGLLPSSGPEVAARPSETEREEVLTVPTPGTDPPPEAFPWKRTGERPMSGEMARELRAMVDQVMQEMHDLDAQSVAAPPGEEASATPDTRTVRQALEGLTPKSRWEIDFSGKITLVGADFEWEQPGEGALQADPARLALPSAPPPPVGFVARYFWQIQEDLDPRSYWVRTLYLDGKQELRYLETQPLLVETSLVPATLDGGIGTVLVQWHYVPLPLDAAREVKILIRKKREGKPGFTAPLVADTGERWLSLGTPFQLPAEIPGGPVPEVPAEASPASP